MFLLLFGAFTCVASFLLCPRRCGLSHSVHTLVRVYLCACTYSHVYVRACNYVPVFPSSVRRKGQGADTPGAKSSPGAPIPVSERNRPLGETADPQLGCETPLEHVVVLERESELRKPEGTRRRAWSGRTGPHRPVWDHVCAEVTKDVTRHRRLERGPPVSVPVTDVWAGTERLPLTVRAPGAGWSSGQRGHETGSALAASGVRRPGRKLLGGELQGAVGKGTRGSQTWAC